MKKVLFISIALSSIIIASCGPKKEKKVYVRPDETDPTWECIIETDSFSREVQVEAIDNDNYIVACTHSVHGINSKGKQSWKTDVLDGNYRRDIEFIAPSNDGNFIIGGNGQDTANASMFGWLGKVTAQGAMLWKKDYHELPGFNDVIITDKGDIAVTGVVSETFYLSRFKPDGELIWNKSYDGVGYNGKGIANTPDGGFIVTNSSDMDTTDLGFHIRTIKTDGDGNVVWSNRYKTDEGDTPYAVFTDNAGNHMIIGISEDTIMHNRIIALKISNEGKQLSLKTQYWEDDIPGSIDDVKQTEKGNYVLCGQLINFRVPYRLMLAELDLDGNAVWVRSVSRSDGSRGGASVAILPNGNLVALGYTSDYNEGLQAGEGASLIAIPGNGGPARKADY